MPDDRISMSEIARRLGVTLAAVSNWRRRHPSFPSARETGGKELFMVEEIANWLDGRRISVKDLNADELPGTTYGSRFRTVMLLEQQPPTAHDDLWKALYRLRGAEDIVLLADLVLSLVYLAASDEHRWNDIVAEPRRCLAIPERDARDPVLVDVQHARRVFLNDLNGELRLAEIVRVVDRIRRSGQSATAFEFLLEKFAVAEGRRDAAVYTPPDVVRLLVEVVTTGQKRAAVFDPCCGSGGFLVGAAKYLAAHGGRIHEASFTGHALSERSASIARMNLLLRGVTADVDVRADAFVREEELGADRRFTVVVSNPPFDMRESLGSQSDRLRGPYGVLPRNSTNFAWLQYAVSSLTDDGRAAVVMPGSTLFSEGAEEQVRGRMIDAGVVEAIIALPPQLFASTGIPVTVWLLGRPPARPRVEILVIDASDLGHMISRTQRSLSGEDRSRIVDTVARWRTGNGFEDERGFSASVAIDRIRGQDHVLTPARYVGTNLNFDTPRRSVHELRSDLAELGRHAAEADAAVERQLDRIRAWTR